MFTGSANNKKLLRFLPALNITSEHIDLFFEALKRALK
jgi:acetylornithine aminotransferase